MLKEFDKEYIIHNKGCYSLEEIEELSFINKKSITINDILKSEIKVRDKGWFLATKCDLNNEQKRDLAYKVAYTVLPIFETKNPNDKRVRECLEAIQLFNNKKITKKQLMEKRFAAYDVYDDVRDDAALSAVHAADAVYYDIDNAYSALSSAAYATDIHTISIKSGLRKKESYANILTDSNILIETMINFCKNIKE